MKKEIDICAEELQLERMNNRKLLRNVTSKLGKDQELISQYSNSTKLGGSGRRKVSNKNY